MNSLLQPYPAPPVADRATAQHWLVTERANLDQARHHWQQALTHYTDLGVPNADDVRTDLTATASTRPRESPVDSSE